MRHPHEKDPDRDPHLENHPSEEVVVLREGTAAVPLKASPQSLLQLLESGYLHFPKTRDIDITVKILGFRVYFFCIAVTRRVCESWENTS